MSFFDTEEFHAVIPASGSPCGISAVWRNPLWGIPQDKDGGGPPWRDNTGIWPCFLIIRVSMAMSKALSSQVWARGDLPLRDIPVLGTWMCAKGTGAHMYHREQAGSEHLPGSVQKKTSLSPITQKLGSQRNNGERIIPLRLTGRTF